MAWAELVEKRGQKVKHFYDADTDKYRAEFTIHDRHYKDEFDDWLEVDENFEDGGVHDKKCDKTRHAIHVGNGERVGGIRDEMCLRNTLILPTSNIIQINGAT